MVELKLMYCFMVENLQVDSNKRFTSVHLIPSGLNNLYVLNY